MYDAKKAKLAALKFLVKAEVGTVYKYEPVLNEIATILPDMDNETINQTMQLLYVAGYVGGIGGVMFDGNCWHEFVDVITDELSYSNNYMTYQIRDIVIQLLGVDIDSIVSVLLQQKLIRGVTRYVNGRYITVYTKTW